jgi:membrane protease YdiL (CAAX protease family)
MPALPSYALFLYVAALAAGVWVLLDGRTRLAHRPFWEPFVWSLGTAIPFTLPIFLPMYLLGARAPDRSGRWGPAEMLGIAIFFAITLPVVATLAGLREDSFTLASVSIIILAQNAGFVLLAVLGIAVRYRLPLASLGLTARRWVFLLLFGLVVGAAMIPTTWVAQRAGVELVALVKGREAALLQEKEERARDPLNRIIKPAADPVTTAWLMLLLGVAVPVGEEVYFRGVVYGGLRQRYGMGWGLLGSTLFFGAVHRQVVHFLPIALLGLIFALLYDRTESLLPSITVHAVNNIISVLGRLYGWEI